MTRAFRSCAVDRGGRGGIRTLEAVLPPTRFPVARTRPGYATLPSVVCGGEGGVRTHGGSSPHRFSRAAPSTTRTPLQLVKYTNAVSPDGARSTCGQQNRPAGTGRRVRGTPGRIRTCGLWVRNPTLYPLSYRRASGRIIRVYRTGDNAVTSVRRREGRD